MNTMQKLRILGASSEWDTCGPRTKQCLPGVYHARTSNGTCRLMKVLFTNKCVHDCKYCVNSSSCSRKRVSFKPEELAHAFLEYKSEGLVDGLFLSSAVSGDSDLVAENMVECAELIREHFSGYMHLKVLPGVSKHYIKRLCSLADRVSLNMEAPNKSRFCELTSTKDFRVDVMRRLSWLSDFKLKAGVTTQFVVGALNESDADFLKTMRDLYSRFSLRRIYFKAFEPLPGTSLENSPPEVRVREHRLYQVDWLLRVYGFKHDELRSVLGEDGFLPLNKDPKLVWALDHPDFFPVDVGEAVYDDLIRVPGVGPRTARSIISSRRNGLNNFSDLSNLGVSRNSLPFLQVSGRKQALLSNFN